MSDAAAKRPNRPVSLNKSSAPAGRPRGGKAAMPAVPIPKTIQWATWAIIAQVVFTISGALLANGYTAQLTKLMIDNNKHAKKPDENFNAVKSLADYRKGLLFQGIVLALVFLFIAYTLRRSRGAGGARWGFLIISVLVAQTNGPLTVLPIADYPGPLSVVRTLMGLSSLAAIVLMFLPASSQYFRDCKAANRPAGAPVRPGRGALFGGGGASTRPSAGRPAAARPGLLGSLFAPRPAPGSAPDRAADPTAPPRPRSKAKVRAEADAVAKGADLARTRAKASKSRRTET